MSSFLQTDLSIEIVDLARSGDRDAREHIYRTFERPVRARSTISIDSSVCRNDDIERPDAREP